MSHGWGQRVSEQPSAQRLQAELALKVIQGRWKLLILRELIDGARRFSDLQRAPADVQHGVSQKVLTAQLAVLDGLHAWGERAVRRQA